MKEYLDVKESLAVGIRWFGFSNFLNYTLQFVITIFLARILFPKDFGVINIALIINNLILGIRDFGFDTAIVQKKNVDKNYLSTAFWLSFATSLIFFVSVVSISSFIAKFFNNPVIQPVVIFMAIKFIIDSLGTTQIAFLKNNLLFSKLAFAEILEIFSYGTLAIILAVRGFGIWSLVFGYLAGSLLKLLFLWRVSSWRPILVFCFKSFKELFKFGKNIVGFNIFSSIANNIDFFIIGKFLGVVNLGFYSLMYNIAYFPRLKISFILSRVAFPVFSKIQENIQELQSNYLKLIKYMSAITFPLLFGLMSITYPFIKVVFGDKWLPIVPSLRIFCIAGIAYSITALSGIVYLSCGRSDIHLRFSMFNFLTLFFAIVMGLKYGLKGIVTLISLQAVLINILAQVLVKKIIDIKLKDYFRFLSPAFFCSLLMAMVLVAILKNQPFSLPDKLKLIISIVWGAAIYFILFYFIDRAFLKELKDAFYKIIWR